MPAPTSLENSSAPTVDASLPPAVPVAGKTATAAASVLLVLGGAMNPVHMQHCEVLLRTASALTERGVNVAGCCLAPAPDGYVRRKMTRADYAIPGHHRVAMCALASGQHALLRPPARTYGSALECGKAESRPGESVAIVVGADRAVTRRGPKWRRPRPGGAMTVVVGRPGETESLVKQFQADLASGAVVEPETFIVLAMDTEPTGVAAEASSTAVRAAMFGNHDPQCARARSTGRAGGDTECGCAVPPDAPLAQRLAPLVETKQWLPSCVADYIAKRLVREADGAFQWRVA